MSVSSAGESTPLTPNEREHRAYLRGLFDALAVIRKEQRDWSGEGYDSLGFAANIISAMIRAADRARQQGQPTSTGGEAR